MSEHELPASVRFDCAECSPHALQRAENRDGQLMRSVAALVRIRQEAAEFERAWPRMASATPLPPVTWEALDWQLRNLAASKTQADLVSGFLASIRRSAGYKPPELVLRELLCLASVVMDAAEPAQPEGEN